MDKLDMETGYVATPMNRYQPAFPCASSAMGGGIAWFNFGLSKREYAAIELLKAIMAAEGARIAFQGDAPVVIRDSSMIASAIDLADKLFDALEAPIAETTIQEETNDG